jgi:hypothetical protein
MGDMKKTFSIITLLIFILYAVFYLWIQHNPSVSTSYIGPQYALHSTWGVTPIYGYKGAHTHRIFWYSYEGKIDRYYVVIFDPQVVKKGGAGDSRLYLCKTPCRYVNRYDIDTDIHFMHPDTLELDSFETIDSSNLVIEAVMDDVMSARLQIDPRHRLLSLIPKWPKELMTDQHRHHQ